MTDPRRLGGDISGPGGPFDKDSVVIDTTDSVLLDAVNVATMTNPSDGRRLLVMRLGGRINRALDRADVLYLFDPDGAAGIVSELLALVVREGGPMQAEFDKRLRSRMEDLGDLPDA